MVSSLDYGDQYPFAADATGVGIRTKAQTFLDTLPAPFTNNEAKELTWIDSIACYKNTFIVWSGQIFSIVSAPSTFFANIMVNFQFAVNDLKEREAQFVEQNSLFKCSRRKEFTLVSLNGSYIQSWKNILDILSNGNKEFSQKFRELFYVAL